MLVLLSGACASCKSASVPGSEGGGPSLPLALVSDVSLPGAQTRFDYQEIDAATNRLVVAHMNDNSVLILDLRDGSLLKVVPNIPTPRGVAIAGDVGLIFVSAMPNQLVLIDASMTETKRVTTGNGPDGVGWDPADKVVATSDQGDGAISLIASSGSGARTAIPLGTETGNVIFDAGRGQFWITAVKASPPDQLVEIDPKSNTVTTSIGLPGCSGAHGLRLHPDGQSAFVACEGNDKLARVTLDAAHTVAIAASGSGPDVLSIDPGIGWLYLAAESGDLTVFDINQPGTTLVGHDSPGTNSHSVAADPATHRVFFPLTSGPVLRIMKPGGL
jgi:DNA-binding beta-propeller fold protein YncE